MENKEIKEITISFDFYEQATVAFNGVSVGTYHLKNGVQSITLNLLDIDRVKNGAVSGQNLHNIPTNPIAVAQTEVKSLKEKLLQLQSKIDAVTDLSVNIINGIFSKITNRD